MTASRLPLLDRLAVMMRRRGMRGVGALRRGAARFVTTTEVTAATRFGSRFRLRLGDYIDNVVLTEGYYESEVLEAMHEGVPEGAAVWDVGANFGLHCVTLKLLRPDLRVVAFEPAPEQAARLIENAMLNGVSIEVLTMGLGSEAAIGRLHVVRSGNPGMTTFVPWSGATYEMALHCQIETGDALVERGIVPKPSVVKLDIEGGEDAALAGLARSIAGALPKRLILEGGDDLAASMGRRGFSVRELVRAEATEHQLRNFVCER